ncbi:TAT-binding protein-like protein 7, AAA ATPase [Malassezia psittaci]|uniref:TAT-binding protein-like protein 7, AAA ATPase n=1 Tax=Malassezia psittaci TaxID=1821823 RepID=A0AAF0JEZ1_9BASI|nr:TAT-binding protein-like protein 7, AAA ATPase [Malassezia psittaci]
MPQPVPRRSSRRDSTSESPKRQGLRRRATQGQFYAQYFAEGELSQEENDDLEEDVHAPQDSDQEAVGVKSDENESRTASDAEIQAKHASKPVRFTRSGRRSQSYIEPDWNNDDEDDYVSEKSEDLSDKNASSTKSLGKTSGGNTRRTRSISKSLRDFVAPDDDDDDDDGNADYGETMRARRASERQTRRNNLRDLAANRSAKRRQNSSLPPTPPRMRSSARLAARTASSADPHTSEDTASSASEQEPSASGRSYSFRTRKKINYSQVAPPSEPVRDGFGRRIRRSTRASRSYDFANEPPTSFPATRSAGKFLLPSLPYSALPRPIRNHTEIGMDKWPRSMSGKDYATAFGEADDSSDDEPQRTLSAPTNLNTPGGLLENGPAPARAGLEAAGQDSLGRVRSHNDPLADIDPLGVDMNVDFTQVGGLEHHVQQLKEMVTLPLLYPELFQRFGVAPPRGVLFHGPPGTGKTLVARALAASCSSTGQSISFFMRKGADCLSKWVGEAERQLRLLFDEAKNVQPSIIFFDEIDGLAPVRSSKQDQIHASIVSTLLALMDGMDGRGQVIVIGATNRPDSIDPALRRPGRFDREFYFPLPNKAARQSILGIHTRKWDPPVHPALQEVLADATIGYGGADLRALCTEATLNAIQRQYPQIYHTNDRLQLDPSSVHVAPHDFVLALESR